MKTPCKFEASRNNNLAASRNKSVFPVHLHWKKPFGCILSESECRQQNEKRWRRHNEEGCLYSAEKHSCNNNPNQSIRIISLLSWERFSNRDARNRYSCSRAGEILLPVS